MYRIRLFCENVPIEGVTAAHEIENEFREHRPHHTNVTCTYSGGCLWLSAENDYDPNGLALMDEFSDCISAYIAELFDGEIRILSITTS